MSLAQFEDFLVEMQQNEQCILIIDFKSPLGGLGVFSSELKDQIKQAGLETKYFTLDIVYNPQCHFAKMFNVSEPPRLVALNTKDKSIYTTDATKLLSFISS